VTVLILGPTFVLGPHAALLPWMASSDWNNCGMGRPRCIVALDTTEPEALSRQCRIDSPQPAPASHFRDFFGMSCAHTRTHICRHIHSQPCHAAIDPAAGAIGARFSNLGLVEARRSSDDAPGPVPPPFETYDHLVSDVVDASTHDNHHITTDDTAGTGDDAPPSVDEVGPFCIADNTNTEPSLQERDLIKK